MVDAKIEAFKQYDFDADEGWAAHLKKVEIPSASANDGGAALLKLKAKYYAKNVDGGLDVAAAVAALRPLPTSTRAPPTPPQPDGGATRRPAAAAAAASAAAAGSSSAPSSASSSAAAGGGWRGCPPLILGMPPDRLLALLQALVLVLSVAYLLPILPAATSLKAYRFALACAGAARILSLLQAHGAPAAASLAALQAWAPRALQSAHFGAAITCLMFMSPAPVTLVLAPEVISAAYGVVGYCALHHPRHPLYAQLRGPQAHAFLQAHKPSAAALAARLDIALALQMLLLVFTPARNLVTTYFVWNQLRQRYWGPETGPHHRAAWAALDAATRPLRERAPVVDKPVALVARWFAGARAMYGPQPQPAR